MNFKLDLISKNLRPEYEALRENLKQIRSQCFDESPQLLNSWRDGIDYPKRSKISLATDAYRSVNCAEGVERCPIVSAVPPGGNETATRTQENDTIVSVSSGRGAGNGNEMPDRDGAYGESIAELKTLDEEQGRREFGQKLLEILDSEEFNVYQQKFNAPRDLEFVLSTLISSSVREQTESVPDIKIRQDLEKLFYDVLKTPECEHYKKILRGKSPKFDQACKQRKTTTTPPTLEANRIRRQETAANTNKLLVPKGLAKMCQPFCPAFVETKRPKHPNDIPVKIRAGTEIIAPFIDSLFLLVFPQITLELF